MFRQQQRYAHPQGSDGGGSSTGVDVGMNQIKTLPTKKSPQLVYEGKAQASLDPAIKQWVYMETRVIRHRCQDTGG
jgi:hypothetical protein